MGPLDHADGASDPIAEAASRLVEQSTEEFTADFADHLWWMATALSPDGNPQHEISAEDRSQQRAYWTPLLASRSLKALRKVRALGKDFAPRRAEESDVAYAERRRQFQDEVDRNEQLLRLILTGLQAQEGVLTTPRNARRRAEHRLAQLNLSRDLPRGTISQLAQEERGSRRR